MAYQRYKAWDLPTRLFHWINFTCVVLLSLLGLVMLNKNSLGISGTEAKVALKVLHVTVGYIFATNLAIRIIWGFVSSNRSRWSSALPGKAFKGELDAYKSSIKAGEPQLFVGHNPKGKLAVLALMGLMIVLLVSGMIRAGTDIYYPPFGGAVTSYIVADGVDPATLIPYDKTGVDPEKYAAMKAFKSSFGKIHLYGAYLLWVLVLIHIAAVVRSEVAGEGDLVSGMISGNKILAREPTDK